MGKYDFELDLKTKNTMSVMDSWIEQSANVLELGSANGRLTKYLSQVKKCLVTIVEIDEEAGREASCYAQKAYIGTEDGNILNFKWTQSEIKFDYIVIADVLEHLQEPELVLLRCKEVLKPDGLILVSIPNIAHNSVLIDLYNDRFDYSETGLLDKTHIHFFTYYTFVELVKKAGLNVIQQEAIYSQVGWNEIRNSYEDIPGDVEKILRYRKSGSIYQYVFKLSLEEDNKTKNDISSFDDSGIQYGKAAEASCYIWEDTAVVEPALRIGCDYNINTLNLCSFNVGKMAQRVRIDLMEDSLFVKVVKVIVDAEGKKGQLNIRCSNAKYSGDNVYYFANNDPWLELDVSEYVDKKIDSLEVEFIILDYNISDLQNAKYDTFIYHFMGNEFQNTKIKLDSISQEYASAKKYIQHLEKDILEQKNYVEHLEKDSLEQKEYIGHLEEDIKELKDYIDKLPWWKRRK